MPEMNGVLLSILHELHFSNIDLFKNVTNAWHQFQRAIPDLIICDWYPEKYDTLELLKQVRSAKAGSDTPFIIVSGIIEHDLVKQAIAMGVSEYIVKPFTMNMFEQKIQLALTKEKRHFPIPKTRETFQTLVGVCINEEHTLNSVLTQLNSYSTKTFNAISDGIIHARSDKTLDVLVVDDTSLANHITLQDELLKFINSGQLEVIIVSSEYSSKVINQFRQRGFKHIVDIQNALADIEVRTDLIINLKKALLHTKDTVLKAAAEANENKEFENNLLESIQVEASNISQLSEQIQASAKKSSYAYQLSEEIHQRAGKIESYKSVLTSSLKDFKTLERSEKESVSISDVIETANNLFNSQLKQRKITLVNGLTGKEMANVNPTLFASLFMFLMRSIILDTRYESNIELNAQTNTANHLTNLLISAEMTGFPHLKDITKHTWFGQDGTLNFVLKDTIAQLCESQLHHYDIEFDQASQLLKVSIDVVM